MLFRRLGERLGVGAAQDCVPGGLPRLCCPSPRLPPPCQSSHGRGPWGRQHPAQLCARVHTGPLAAPASSLPPLPAPARREAPRSRDPVLGAACGCWIPGTERPHHPLDRVGEGSLRPGCAVVGLPGCGRGRHEERLRPLPGTPSAPADPTSCPHRHQTCCETLRGGHFPLFVAKKRLDLSPRPPVRVLKVTTTRRAFVRLRACAAGRGVRKSP